MIATKLVYLGYHDQHFNSEEEASRSILLGKLRELLEDTDRYNGDNYSVHSAALAIEKNFLKISELFTK